MRVGTDQDDPAWYIEVNAVRMGDVVACPVRSCWLYRRSDLATYFLLKSFAARINRTQVHIGLTRRFMGA